MSSSAWVKVLNLHVRWLHFYPEVAAMKPTETTRQRVGYLQILGHSFCALLDTLVNKFAGKIPQRNRRRGRHGGRAPEWF